MSFRSQSLLCAAVLAFTVLACTAGSVTGSGDPNNPDASSSDPTDPALGSSGTGTGSGALGPACTEYLACCAEIAAKNPQLGASCDSVKTQITNAQTNGISTSNFEASCKSGVGSMKSAGYCTSATPTPTPTPKSCVPSCKTDADCASSCPPVSGGVACCDGATGVCYASKSATCPKPPDDGDPPPSY